MMWLAANWSILGLLLGGVTGLGGVPLAGLRIWSNHLKMLREAEAVKRKQSDTVALDLVEELSGQVKQLRADQVSERRYCEEQLSLLRYELRNELTFSDALVLAIRHAPARAVAVIDDALNMREARRAAEARAQLHAVVDEVAIMPDPA